MGALTCAVCRASSADPSEPMLCDRGDCPAVARIEQEARESSRRAGFGLSLPGIDEVRERLAFWDSFMPVILAAFLLAAALPVHATLPTDSVVIFIKTAKFTVKKQYRDSAGTLKTATVARYASAQEAKEAVRLLPPLKGGLLYIIAPPDFYANVIECTAAHGAGGICTDVIDQRLFIQ